MGPTTSTLVTSTPAATSVPTVTVTPFINPSSLPGMFPAARFVDIGTLMNIISPLLTVGAALVFGYMLLRAAFLWLTAADDMEKIAQAKQMVTYAIVGIIIILSAYMIVKLIGFIFKVDIPL